MRIGNYFLQQHCYACPESYYVYNEDGDEVGYLRLRHGSFSAYAGDEVVHVSNPEGDGIFEEDERNYHLENGVIAIANYYKEKQNV